MRRYLKVYRALLKINFVTLTTFRMNFVNSVISSIIWGIFSVVTILIITARGSTFFGWSKEELILLTGVYGLIVGIFHVFFAHNFKRFAWLMAEGKFDPVLLKPLDSQFSISFWIINYSAISRVLMGLGLIFYLLFILGYTIGVIEIILFLILLVVGLAVLYSLWLIATTFLIWIPQMSNIIEVMFTVNGLTRYPSEMSQKISKFLFFVLLPVVFVASSPFKALIGKITVLDIVGLLFVCVFFFIISRLFWKYALRYYTSASN